MHILYLSATGGGLDTNVRVLGPEMVRRGHRVSILYIHFSNARNAAVPCAMDGCTVYEATIGNAHYYLSRALMRRSSLPALVRTFEYAQALGRMVQHIHARDEIDLMELPEVFITPKQVGGVPFAVRLHSAAWLWRRMTNEASPFADRFEVQLEARTLQHAAGISAPSKLVSDHIRAMCGLNAKPIEIIPYPIDVNQFVPAPKSAHPIVLFVGRVEKRKGADVLMRAIPLVWAKHPDCEFAFVGRVCDDVKLQTAALPSRVQFLGVRPRDELVWWYQRASIFVAPSLWDNSPNTIYEAMACGTPVIASRTGGIPELVDDGETGLLVPPDDPDDLADAIITLLGDPSRRERMAQRGREKVMAEYSVDKIQSKTLGFYERALSGR